MQKKIVLLSIWILLFLLALGTFFAANRDLAKVYGIYVDDLRATTLLLVMGLYVAIITGSVIFYYFLDAYFNYSQSQGAVLLSIWILLLMFGFGFTYSALNTDLTLPEQGFVQQTFLKLAVGLNVAIISGNAILYRVLLDIYQQRNDHLRRIPSQLGGEQ
jgi:hypothetical protein